MRADGRRRRQRVGPVGRHVIRVIVGRITADRTAQSGENGAGEVFRFFPFQIGVIVLIAILDRSVLEKHLQVSIP